MLIFTKVEVSNQICYEDSKVDEKCRKYGGFGYLLVNLCHWK